MAYIRHAILYLQSVNVIIHLEVIQLNIDAMEKQFEHYPESREYEEAEDRILSAIRKAYHAGWNVAMLERICVEEPAE